MESRTIQETFILPSKGLLYSENFSPNITLRSMTTEEEMRRLSYSDSEYEKMAKIIDDCIIEDLPISSYDMCIGDYQFLLHKLRIVSHGKDYNMVIQCPNCGEIVKATVDLDEEEVFEFDPDVGLDTNITLPISKKEIKLRLQTPRMIDAVKEKAQDMRKKTKFNIKYEYLFTIMSLIDKVDSKTVNEIALEKFVRELPIQDANYILAKGDELNGKVGLDTSVIAKCSNCGFRVVTNFREQPEFYGPQVD